MMERLACHHTTHWWVGYDGGGWVAQRVPASRLGGRRRRLLFCLAVPTCYIRAPFFWRGDGGLY